MIIGFIGLRMYPSNFEGVSGIETRTEELIDYLIKKHQVIIYVRSWLYKNNLAKKENNLILSSIFSFKNKFLDTSVYSLIASVKVCFSPVQVVFYEGTGSTLFCFLPKLFGKKVITTAHSLEWQRKKWNIIAKFGLILSEWSAVHFSHKLITVAESLDNYFRKKYNKETTLIPYYLEFKKSVKASIITKKYKLKPDSYLLFIGRFTPEKRIEWLIKAFNKLIINKKLVLIGGKTHDKSYYNYILSLAKKNKNIFLTGHVFDKEKEEFLSNCFLFILPSEVEGLSMALLEALSYNKRVFIGNISGLSNYFTDNKFLFEVNSFEDFENKLKTTLTSHKDKNMKSYINLNKFISRKEFFEKYIEVLSSI